MSISGKALQAKPSKLMVSRSGAVFGTAVLTLVYLMAYCDRTIVTVLVGAIKADLAFTDQQVALLIGLSFAMFYSLAGLPLGRLTDTLNRRNLIMAGLVSWSAATAACGLLNKFPSLLTARVCVGIGEACLVPAALSMIADYFGPQQRAKAIAVFVCGAPLGSGLAYLVGGTLLNRLQANGSPNGMEVLTHYPWQLIFLVLGALGLLLVGVLAAVTEPPRTVGAVTGPQGGDYPKESLTSLLSANKALFTGLVGGPAIMSMAFYALLAWGPAMAERRFGWDSQDIATWFTPLGISSGVLGPWIGVWLGMRLAQSSRSDGLMHAVVCLGGVAGALSLAAMLVPFGGLSICLMFGASGLLLGVIALPQVAIQYVIPGNARGRVTALFVFAANVIGFGLGPLLVATLTDHVFARESSLNVALAIVCTTAVLVGGTLTSVLMPQYLSFAGRPCRL